MADVGRQPTVIRSEKQSRSSAEASRRHHSQHSQITAFSSRSLGSGEKDSSMRGSPEPGSFGTVAKSNRSLIASVDRSRTMSSQGKPNTPSSPCTPEGQKRRMKSRRSSGRWNDWPVDFGLGLLDDPFHNDPLLQAQIAELHRRVESINPAALPTLSPPSLTAVESAWINTPPSPRQTFEPTRPPTDAFISKAGDFGPVDSNLFFASESPKLRQGTHRRHLGDLFLGIKEKVSGRHKEGIAFQHSDDTGQALRYLQAENRIRAYREALRPSTIERAQAARAQLEHRYTLIYSAIARRERPPNLLDVIKWRRTTFELRRSISPRLVLPTGSTHLSGPLKSRTSASAPVPLRTIEEAQTPSPYAVESHQLQWLPHLATLYLKFLQPLHSRKEMVDWHVTAQAVSEYVQRDQDLEDHWANDYPGSVDLPLYGPSTSPSPSSSGQQVYMISMQPPVGDMSPRSSSDREASRRINHRGFHLSLSGIRHLPRAGVSRASLSSPQQPRSSQEFSPSSSRRDLGYVPGLGLIRTHVSDGADVSDFSGSDGEGDANIGLRDDGVLAIIPQSISRRSTQPDQILSASEDDPAGKSQSPSKARSPMGRSSSRRWVGPLIARLALPTPSVARNNAQISDDPQSSPAGEIKRMEESSLPAPTPTPGPVLDHPFTANPISRFSHTIPRGESVAQKGGKIRRERMEMRQRNIYAMRASLIQRLHLQDHNITTITSMALTQVATYVQLKMLMDSTLGGESDDVISDLLHAFAPIPDSSPREGASTKGTWLDVDMRHYRREESLTHLQKFFESSPTQPPWSHPPPIHEPAASVMTMLQATAGLEEYWTSVAKELEELRLLQAKVTESMGRVLPYCEAAAMRIDTAYPELGRNIDLARQLSASGQSTLPYISSLPPWAREMLAPVIEYTLELVGFIIRWLLYPIWRVLPRWVRVALTFIAVITLSVVAIMFSLTGKYWSLSYSLGLWLSNFALFRYPVLVCIVIFRAFVSFLRRHWKNAAFVSSLVIFWYITTPQLHSG
ncbi:uncharacterized protein EI90DRAFT_3086982 [Cantharellus anzutake]|uniref:uncharacterized protein n=1 Tax=Cantharellus anzutake TaxID=1750568 RepID=UPI0019044434|nr:uncharacterized protein EI90DRAFT_3086982 [Cantharellus anzutake]KAF8316208.1 hypothetical protein EI90DRAFT_3086982 [Cantharellus anzutake]